MYLLCSRSRLSNRNCPDFGIYDGSGCKTPGVWLENHGVPNLHSHMSCFTTLGADDHMDSSRKSYSYDVR